MNEDGWEDLWIDTHHYYDSFSWLSAPLQSIYDYICIRIISYTIIIVNIHIYIYINIYIYIYRERERETLEHLQYIIAAWNPGRPHLLLLGQSWAHHKNRVRSLFCLDLPFWKRGRLHLHSASPKPPSCRGCGLNLRMKGWMLSNCCWSFNQKDQEWSWWYVLQPKMTTFQACTLLSM